MAGKQQIALDQCMRFLASAISTVNLYGHEHPQVVKHCKAAHDSLLHAFSENSSFSLLRVDDQLVVDDQPLSASINVNRFVQFLKIHGIGHIRFINKVAVEELYRFVVELSHRSGEVQSSENLRLGQVEVRYRSDGDTSQNSLPVETLKVLDQISSEELAKIMEVYETVKNDRGLHLVGLSEIVAKFVDILASYAEPVLAMAPIRSMDEYTFTHSLNVCLLNLAQATTLGIEGSLLHDIGLSAMLHDIGKLFIPEEVLNKPGKLNDDEWELMQQHPVKGAEYLINTSGVSRMAVVNAYEHHLRYDFRGYPTTKDRWEQNLCSHMTTISDIFDSLRTKRPYREPLNIETTLNIMREQCGTQLHPLLAQNFFALMNSVTSAKNEETDSPGSLKGSDKRSDGDREVAK